MDGIESANAEKKKFQCVFCEKACGSHKCRVCLKWCHAIGPCSIKEADQEEGFGTSVLCSNCFLYRKYCSKDSKELDGLFLEIGALKAQLERLNKTAFSERSVDEKWAAIFKDPSFVYLKKIVSILLSIFSSNAYCESVFSVVKNVKTDERNRMKIKLLNSLVSIKLNSDYDCSQAYKLFISDAELLNKVKSSEKYTQ